MQTDDCPDIFYCGITSEKNPAKQEFSVVADSPMRFWLEYPRRNS
jgi:hypothetical protein